ncbi:hypothetical protein [Adhaeretor mobilis]|uniref:Uncharacterized protein n=1 Tax=Adhaeretor mobilis TaxID=1930276 RepID=A0A517MUJ9_9BACT|nr:hypothetical protein [Adhaeretor mobilis]QDS98558.1 hypothetical protein HG15A2_18390 [Adhaeretor mobilis]
MALLIDFLLRLCLGMAAAMALVPHSQVSSGYFRNHLYVVLGLATLAALLSPSALPAALWWAAGVAVVSYLGAVCWLYERPVLGKAALWIAAGLSTAGLILATAKPASGVLNSIYPISSAMLLGTVMAAMLLGHWYLNAPGMKLEPLQKLLKYITLALFIHAVVCATGLAAEYRTQEVLPSSWWLFVVLRWTCLVGIGFLTYMTWQTLKIPNTQSATGILYVAVIGAFTGEIASLVLSAESTFPI